MAKVTVMDFSDVLSSELSALAGKTDDVIAAALEAGGEVALKAVQKKLKESLGKGKYSRPTGEMYAALGITSPKLAENGTYNIKIGFNEPRKGVPERTNAMIANILEHGKHNQPPRPFLKPAKAACKNDVSAAMKAVFDKELTP